MNQSAVLNINFIMLNVKTYSDQCTINLFKIIYLLCLM